GPVSEIKVSSVRNEIQPDDPATLVYTSGTTGPPKGVVLSHKNILFTARQITTSLDLSPDDLSIAYLPMAHIAERIVGSFMKLASGARTAFAESMDDLIFNMKEVGPTFHFGTPRVYEKFHARIMTAIDDATSFQKIIYRWAENVGSREKDLRLSHQPITWWLHIRYILANWLVFRKVREFMGGKLRFLISGGAPISPAILEWMQSVGLNVLEVYGMTESTGLISVNFIEDNRLGSVGKALPGTKMRIAEDGEILSQGENICLGYFADADATKELVDESGWLYSGDIGRIDKDGYLWITDRKKDLIITAGGKNVAPQNIENLMKTSKYISQFMVFGDRRKYLTGLLTLDEDEITKFARDRQLIYSDQKELSQLSEVTELIAGEIDRLNKQLASFETIKKFRILEEELSQDDEEVTPTLKVKRTVIEKRYDHLIEEMYETE
ncbi:MAG: long-chain fatty acid--CoA ligase, partial [Candidatus Marinimicrobia bacterium]|nr:long-chain fatty acid--CoA ligase [Candidatus Neomarinimicrobiota bacterium]